MSQPRLPPPDALTMSLGEAMFTQRAIRRLAPDLISDDHLKLLIEAASKAPSGGNSQPARYLVIRDRGLIEQFGSLYREAWWAKRADEGQPWQRREEIPRDSIFRMAALLADEMAGAPAIVLCFGTHQGSANSVLPGMQNLMLAARALGIGSVLTTLHPRVMERVYQLFDVPADVEFHGCIPLGYPRGRFGPTARRPAREITYFDAWNELPSW